MPSSAAHKFDRQWSRLFHPFAAVWRSIEFWDKKNFNKTDALLIKMDQIPQFSNFLKLRLFYWKSSNHHKRGFRVIISVRWPYQTFPFIAKKGRFDFGRNFQAFYQPVFWNISIFFNKTPFLPKPFHKLMQDVYWIKTWAVSSLDPL